MPPQSLQTLWRQPDSLDRDHESSAGDARNLVILFADHESAAIVLFLKTVAAIDQQGREIRLFNRIEELAADAGVCSFIAGLPIGFNLACGGRAVLIALGQLRGDELVKDLGCYGWVRQCPGDSGHGAERGSRIDRAGCCEMSQVAF